MLRISIRELLIVVALIALAMASMKYANQTWSMVLSMAFFLALLIAVLVAIVDRGPRQAFALGFGITFVASSLPFSWSEAIGSLPTESALRYVYNQIARVEYVDSRNDEVIRDFDPTNPSLPFPPLGSGYDPSVGYAIRRDVPQQHLFLSNGNRWFSFLLAFCGGHLANIIYWRRLRDEQKLPADTS